jgi:hypothetical protein
MSHPVASLAVLKRTGMDLKKFGCCAKREKDGKETVVLGCEHHRTCPWAAEPVPDATVGEETIEGGLRPRNVKYLLIKPTTDGKRKVKEGYCACYDFHENFGKLHGNNKVVCKVTGGEGASYQARGSKKIPTTVPGQEATWEPVFWSATVPPFRPPAYDDLVAEEYAEKVIQQIAKEDDGDAIRAALSGNDDARNVTLSIDQDEVASILRKAAR